MNEIQKALISHRLNVEKATFMGRTRCQTTCQI